MRVGFSTDPLFPCHATGSGHPERPERMGAILDRVADLDTVPVPPRDATEAELAAAHEPAYVRWVGERIAAGGTSFDADTHAGPQSHAAAVRAAGAGLALAEALERGEIDAGFACVRPPGHHACRARAMGFCLYNNVAVLARYLQARGKRVAIVDWDVHHGNGTQDIFEDDPEVGYCSLHQSPLYPGTGAAGETGAGNVVNLPLEAGLSDDAYLAVVDERVVPWLTARAPDVLLISAGFDAHANDPLAGMHVTAEGFAAMTRRLLLGPPVLSVLEGGYDLEGLGSSVRAHLEALLEADA